MQAYCWPWVSRKGSRFRSCMHRNVPSTLPTQEEKCGLSDSRRVTAVKTGKSPTARWLVSENCLCPHRRPVAKAAPCRVWASWSHPSLPSLPEESATFLYWAQASVLSQPRVSSLFGGNLVTEKEDFSCDCTFPAFTKLKAVHMYLGFTAI